MLVWGMTERGYIGEVMGSVRPPSPFFPCFNSGSIVSDIYMYSPTPVIRNFDYPNAVPNEESV